METKPASLPLIDFFIKKTAIKTLIPENIADLIIKDQWRSLHKKIREEIFVEVSGMGYFTLSRNMTSKAISKLENIIPKTEIKASKIKLEGKRIHTEKMVEDMKENLQMYKKKLAKYENRFPRTNSRNIQQTSREEVGEGNSI